ncbi:MULTISPECIES: YceI family protein [Roseivirga]|jgi:polyisoprenoid-binding protein YceI|uniref:YceI family protein n=1 Tax=Roseivirga TaxID=290180 RepID=UPI00257B7A2B|nr:MULTISPECIES: YceI family protein [Roseivirga]|tara:strand:- start:2523 stop:3119 length:597 start_codon:yes stop_codon:yes gene_type:complete
MKRRIKLLLIAQCLVAIQYTQAQTTEWQIDPTHSSIGFSIDHLVISETVGQFDSYTASIRADKEDFTDAKFEVVIQTKSINTANEERDNHLRSEDFFNAAQFPTITFKGEKFEKVNQNKYKVSGWLTMHGITKKVVFEGQFGGIVADPWGGTRAGLKLWGEIDRYDYGLKYNSFLEAGGLSIGREVRIECRIELIKKT